MRLASLIRNSVDRNRKAGWALIDQSVVSLSNFVSVYLLARFMDVEAFGVFVLAYTGLFFFIGIHNASVTQPHNTLGAKMEGLAYRQFTTLLATFQLSVGTAFCLLLVLIGVVVDLFGIDQYGYVYELLGVLLVPWLAQEYIRRVHYTRQDSRAAAFNDAVSYGGQVIGVTTLVLVQGEPHLADVLLIYGGSSLLAWLFGLWQLRETWLPPRQVFRETRPAAILGDVWRFGKWLIGSDIVRWFGRNGHPWLLSLLVGIVQLGGYRAASHLVNALNPIQQAATAYIPARASTIYEQEGLDGLLKWFKKVAWLLGIPYTIIVVGLIVLAHPLLVLAYGEKFAGQGLEWIVMLSAVSYLFGFFQSLVQMAFVAMELSRYVFVMSLISVGLLGTTGVLSIYLLGIYGVPVSSIIMASVLLFYGLYALRRLKQSAETAPQAATLPAPAGAALPAEARTAA